MRAEVSSNAAPRMIDPNPDPVPHGRLGPRAVFAPDLPPAEVQRHAMQTELASSGWGLWYQMSFMRHVRLPEGQALTLHICHLGAKTCNGPVRSGDGGETAHRLGHHAVDRSYGQLHVFYAGCNVSITFGAFVC